MQPDFIKDTENVILFKPEPDRPLNILAVDDDRIERLFMSQQIKEMGHNVIEAENGQQALQVLMDKKSRIDIVLIDRLMPVLDGVSVVLRMKDDIALKKIPVVMVTGASATKDIKEGIDAGVFYYLTKPVNPEVMKSVVTAAMREAQKGLALSIELKRHSASFHMIETCKFVLRTLEEAEALASFAALCFPEPERVLKGLSELLINAVEHGTYDIGYDAKGILVENDIWRQEVQRRSQLPDYQDRHVDVVISKKDNGIYAVITDQGNGFDWRRYMTIDPSRASSSHGRGIARALAESFDKIAFNEKGNQVVAYVGKYPTLSW